MHNHEITNRADSLDTRDILDRIDYLEIDEDEDEREELNTLRTLIEDTRGYGDTPEDGLHLIRDSYFQDFAEEFADDIGAVDHNTLWPQNHIDWESAADDLRQDYTSVEFAGVTYWFR